ncbi:hypothetical protein [Acidisphaera sp. L21]|uniref:hypothetical protein n=1 Tax=Acidisphaera sp. L21 TaxID=1641851 RepID=UPI001C20493D|nr:hypothetical protein [Acidisphaera sp. L21]
MSTLMYGMALGRMKMGDPNTDQISFLGSTVADLALALERVHASYWQQMEEKERAAEAAERKATKGKKKKEGRQ